MPNQTSLGTRPAPGHQYTRVDPETPNRRRGREEEKKHEAAWEQANEDGKPNATNQNGPLETEQKKTKQVSTKSKRGIIPRTHEIQNRICPLKSTQIQMIHRGHRPPSLISLELKLAHFYYRK
jgi:hypothetical protein